MNGIFGLNYKQLMSKLRPVFGDLTFYFPPQKSLSTYLTSVTFVREEQPVGFEGIPNVSNESGNQ